MAQEIETRSQFQEWYAENGDDLNAKRKERYANDPAYRDQTLRTNQRWRDKRKRANRKEREKQRKAAKLKPTESTWKTVDIEVDGVLTPMYTIGALARAIGRGISTVRVWEREGILPATEHRSPKGDRLYSVDQVAKLRKLLKKTGRLKDAKLLQKKRVPEAVVRMVKFKDGERRQMRLYKVGTLASVVGRTVVSLTQMEKMGRLPITPLRASSLAYRLYTHAMIESVEEAFSHFGGTVRGNAEWDEFFLRIRKNWTSQGIIGARVVETDDGKPNKSSTRRRTS